MRSGGPEYDRGEAMRSPGSKPFPGMEAGHEAAPAIHGQGIGKGGGKSFPGTPETASGYAGHSLCEALGAHADRLHPLDGERKIEGARRGAHERRQ